MNVFLKRAVAASLPLALIATSGIAASANPIRQQVLRTFGVRPFATANPVLGGGATLPVPAYLGRSVNGAFESSGTTSFGVAGSVFAYLASQTGVNIEYCATGSGKGKGVFAGVANTVDTPCSNAASGSTATTFGFLPPSGAPRQTYPTIAGTDAPLTQTDYSAYISNHPSPLEPVELPSLFGAIAILYHDAALSSSAARIVVSDSQICGVYSGSIKTFGALLGNGDSTAIHPIYRLDGSGTSFNFSNHLATVCSGFNGNQTFTTADPKLPATAVGATGNGGVIAAVNATNGAFGYAEAGYVGNSPTGKGPINYADVRNSRSGGTYDPFSGLPVAANSVTSSLLTNVQVVQGTGPATVAGLTGVRSGSCVKVVPPSAYANVSTGYPIVAVTYLLENSNGSGTTNANALRTLENDLSTPSLFKGSPSAKITTVDEAGVATGTTGYSSLSSTYGAAVKAAATSCINA